MRITSGLFLVVSVAAVLLRPGVSRAGDHTTPDDANLTQDTCPPLTGMRIYYDASLGQAPLSSRSNLANALIARGAVIDEVTTPLNDTSGLDDYNVIWLTPMTSAFSGNAYIAIRDFLDHDKGFALFEADDAFTIYWFDNILDDVTECNIRWSGGAATSGSTSNLFPHPITYGLSSLSFPGPGQHFTSFSTPLVQDVNNVNIAAVNDLGGARVVAIADDFFLDSAIMNDDNRDFGLAIFDWFGELILFDLQEIFVSPDTLDTTLTEGDSTTLTVRIDNPENCPYDYTKGIFGSPIVVSSPFFADDFEDGDYNGWIDAGGSGTKAVVSGGADGTPLCYRESNSGGGHDDGIYHTLGAIQPEFVSFWVRVTDTVLSKGYFTLRDTGGRRVIFFHASSAGTFSVNPNVGGNTSVPYTTYQWHWIAFSNIDFVAKTFDYLVDGVLIQSGISFKNPGLVNDFDRLDLYNFHAGAEARWDQIVMGTPVDWLQCTTDPGMVPGLGFVDLEFKIDASMLLPGTYNGLVRVEANLPSKPADDVPVVLVVDARATGIDDQPLPRDARLHQNHPNPFNPQTTIPYEIAERTHVRLAVYRVNGELVRVLTDRDMAPGRFSETWDGTDAAGHTVASGVYLYQLIAGNHTLTKKLVLLK